MSHCCNKESILTDPCQAIADGVLTPANYQSYGITPGQYVLLVAQCGTTVAVEDLAPIIDQLVALATSSLSELQAIEANTDGVEESLTSVISLLSAGNATSEDIRTAVNNVLAEVVSIDDNTDTVEALLTTMNALLTTVESNTDGIEALLTTVVANQSDNDLFGTHTIATGTHAAAPAAGPYSSWVVVKTNADGTVTVDGITLNAAGDSTSEEAQPQYKVPTPTITLDGGNLGEYEWRTKS